MTPEQEKKVREEVGQAVGHASMCWEKPERAGVFDSTEAAKVVDNLVDRLKTILTRSSES